MTLITTTEDLVAFCARVENEPYLAIDTEFMRDRTFWPIACLIQVGASDEAVAVDPLAPGIELAPLLALMAKPDMLKVFHAARQDLEIFYRLSGSVPAPLFDSQIAAMVLGYGEEVSYETLVGQIAHARLDKSSRFTDWSVRPLSEAQLTYALADVIHLRVIYEAMHADLEKRGRLAWVEEEIGTLLDPALYDQPAEQAWLRLKLRSREPRFLAIVRELGTWREIEARRKDVPRARIIRDDLLLEIAASKPRDAEALRSLPRVNLDRESAKKIVEAIARALALPESDLPEPEAPSRNARGTTAIIELLRVLLRLRCEDHSVAPRLVASSGDLEALATDDDADVPALKGWRKEVFGDDALALKHGRIALAVQRRRTVVLPLE